MSQSPEGKVFWAGLQSRHQGPTPTPCLPATTSRGPSDPATGKKEVSSALGSANLVGQECQALFLNPGTATHLQEVPRPETRAAHSTAYASDGNPFFRSHLCTRCWVSRGPLLTVSAPCRSLTHAVAKLHHCCGFLPPRGCELKMNQSPVDTPVPYGVPVLTGPVSLSWQPPVLRCGAHHFHG